MYSMNSCHDVLPHGSRRGPVAAYLNLLIDVVQFLLSISQRDARLVVLFLPLVIHVWVKDLVGKGQCAQTEVSVILAISDISVELRVSHQVIRCLMIDEGGGKGGVGGK